MRARNEQRGLRQDSRRRSVQTAPARTYLRAAPSARTCRATAWTSTAPLVSTSSSGPTPSGATGRLPQLVLVALEVEVARVAGGRACPVPAPGDLEGDDAPDLHARAGERHGERARVVEPGAVDDGAGATAGQGEHTADGGTAQAPRRRDVGGRAERVGERLLELVLGEQGQAELGGQGAGQRRLARARPAAHEHVHALRRPDQPGDDRGRQAHERHARRRGGRSRRRGTARAPASGCRAAGTPRARRCCSCRRSTRRGCRSRARGRRACAPRATAAGRARRGPRAAITASTRSA